MLLEVWSSFEQKTQKIWREGSLVATQAAKLALDASV